jgi:hypothetical protein
MSTLSWREWLEVVYWIAGIIIAGSVVGVFRQVKLAKEALEATREESELRSHRDAILIAAQQCERYAATVIPTSDSVTQRCNEADLEVVEWELEDDNFEWKSFRETERAERWFSELEQISQNKIMTLFNEMEAFAIYFAKGAADEQVAFSAIGPVYCADVRRYAPALIDCRTRAASGHPVGPFENLISLYQIWSARTRKLALHAQAQKVAAEVAKVRVPEMPPLGTRASRKRQE